MCFLYSFVILLAAAIVAVPLAKRFGFGSVLGYLAAGLIVGPSGFGLVSDVESIAQVSELGVVMLLFLIGLELRPQRLWTMRRSVLGLGTAQVAATTAALAGLAYLAGVPAPLALVVAFALSLSSTAIVLPMLGERDLLPTRAGRDSFAVLLFQDMAVIPMVSLIPLLEGVSVDASEHPLVAIVRAVAALGIVFIGGRFFIRPIFRLVDSAKTPEIFTATALVVVGGTAALVNAAGLSMSLGAFIAGVLLSDSEYRHQIRADIQPFEGLLLGVFFISVGMSANLGLIQSETALILASAAILLTIKGAIAFVLGRLSGHTTLDAVRFASAIPQAGEFGFVILATALATGILTREQSELLTVIITLSMLVSPILFWFEERWIAPLFTRPVTRPFDPIDARTDIIICGFGRVGQIVGRILRSRNIAFTALDNSTEQIDLVRRFGSKAYYGDSSRLDVLRAAGAAEAKILVVTLGDIAQSLTLVDHARRHFPHLKILVRVRNRRHAHLMMDRGVTGFVRETFHSSLRLGEEVMLELGISAEEAARTVSVFAEHDERQLIESHSYYDDEKQMIQNARQVSEELKQVLEAQARDLTPSAR